MELSVVILACVTTGLARAEITCLNRVFPIPLKIELIRSIGKGFHVEWTVLEIKRKMTELHWTGDSQCQAL